MWEEKVKKQFKKEEVPIVLEILNRFDKYAIGEAILFLSKGELYWVRQYAKLAKRKPDEILQAHYVKRTIQERLKAKSKSRSLIPTNAENIDDLLMTPFKDFMNNLQTCDFGCCGIGGVSLNPEDIKSALKRHDASELLKIILKLQLQIRQISQPCIKSGFLNALMDKSEMLDILKIFRNIINNEIQQNKQSF